MVRTNYRWPSSVARGNMKTITIPSTYPALSSSYCVSTWFGALLPCMASQPHPPRRHTLLVCFPGVTPRVTAEHHGLWVGVLKAVMRRKRGGPEKLSACAAQGPAMLISVGPAGAHLLVSFFGEWKNTASCFLLNKQLPNAIRGISQNLEVGAELCYKLSTSTGRLHLSV